jgi:hypothetical protein
MITRQKHIRSIGTISPNVRDYGNEPFFLKKAEDSKKVLEKHGLPPAFFKRSDK